MSLAQYKDANRAELWNILQIQQQTLEEEIRKNMVLEEENRLLKQGYGTGHELNTRCDELSQGQFVYAYYMQENSNPIDFYNWLVKWNHLKASKIKEGE